MQSPLPEAEARLATIAAAASEHRLFVSGTVEIRADELGADLARIRATLAASLTAQSEVGAAEGSQSDAGRVGETDPEPQRYWLALLSADEPGFWQHVTAQSEFLDGDRNPLDRWSRRAVSAIAQQLGVAAVFPFGGPPWLPFLRWTARSGRSFDAPVVLQVHDRMGLWASWRGALVLDRTLPQTANPAGSPCQSCALQPCKSACPANALVEGHYYISACHSWLNQPEGEICLTQGCLVRKACPISRLYGRLPEESAHHMRHFHP